MGLFRMLKPPKNQTFSYKPRFWDPKKEEAEQRRERVRQLEEGGVENMKARIQGGFRKGAGGVATMKYRSSRVKRANGTLFIVLVCLLVLAYVGMVYYVPEIDAVMNNAGDGAQAPVGPPTE